jgi:nitrate reductase cytochrome c-type subunit
MKNSIKLGALALVLSLSVVACKSGSSAAAVDTTKKDSAAVDTTKKDSTKADSAKKDTTKKM